VALDYRLAVSAATERLAGVRVELIDGDRALRVRVDPARTLTVFGLVGEPMLRFDRGGVWVARSSATAQSDRLVSQAGSGWEHATSGHVYTWHDHRLSPPPLPSGGEAPWRFAAKLDGRRVELAGSFVRVPRPPWWPWALGAAAAVAALALLRRAHVAQGVLATALAAVATGAALAAQLGYTTGDTLAGTGRWLQVVALGVLAVAAVALLALDRRRRHVWAPMLIGVVAAVLCLGSLNVFWHGVVVSALPDWAARLTTLAAVVAGAGAAALGALADDGDADPRQARLASR
jgi:hypothetical protein